MTLLGFMLSLIIVTSADESGVSQSAVMRVAGMIDSISARHRSIDTTFSTHRHYLVPRDSLGELPDLHAVPVCESHWRTTESKMAIDERHISSESAGDIKVRYFWDGQGLYHQVSDDKGGSIGRSAREAISDASALLFNQRLDTYLTAADDHYGSLAEAIRIGSPTKYIETDEEVSYRFRLSEPADNVVIHIVLTKEPQLHLSRLTWEIAARHPQRNQSGFRARCEFVVDEVALFDGALFPIKAHRDLFLHTDTDNETGPLLVGRNTYRRESASVIPESTPMERDSYIQFEEGGFVSDRRSNIGYVQGGTRLVVNGVRYETPEPILAHPGYQLPDLIRQSVRLGAPTGHAALAKSTVPMNSPVRNTRPWMLALASSLLALVALTIRLRHSQDTEVLNAA